MKDKILEAVQISKTYGKEKALFMPSEIAT